MVVCSFCIQEADENEIWTIPCAFWTQGDLKISSPLLVLFSFYIAVGSFLFLLARSWRITRMLWWVVYCGLDLGGFLRYLRVSYPIARFWNWISWVGTLLKFAHEGHLKDVENVVSIWYEWRELLTYLKVKRLQTTSATKWFVVSRAWKYWSK